MRESREHFSPIFDELRSIQRRHGYLPGDELRALSDRLQIPLYRINSVASFYPLFFLAPPARAEVRVCGDMSCHLRGGTRLRQGLEARLAPLGTQAVNIRHVSCLGRCDHAPAIAVNDVIFDDVQLAGAEELVQRALRGEPLAAPHAPDGMATRIDPYEPEQRYGALRALVASRRWEDAIATLKASGLRGLGGAGFPTGLKWEIVRKAQSDQKYIVCNADESEPGTIKDRFIMTHAAHLVIEGMIIAGLVAGATHGIFYIRHEYTEQEHILAEEMKRCYAAGLLGPSILGSGLAFDLDLFVSPGGYICGEESALLEAIEGKRSEPRNKPPFPGQAGGGLWQKPTAINNVETFAFVPAILARGADWYKNAGRNGSAGLKFIGVSGHVKRPGVFEIQMGITYRDLIEGLAGGAMEGHTLKAFAPSGPAGGYLPASMLDLAIDWNAMAQAGSTVGSGAVVVCDERACMLDMALNSVTFFRNESCGKCVPCRVGSQKMTDLLHEWTHGTRAPGDLKLFDDLSNALRLTSICGLGQVVPVPIASVMKHFREEVDAHVTSRRCAAGVCFGGAGLPA